MEIWKEIENSKIYEISNYGNVRSIDRIDNIGRIKNGKILKKTINKQGYEYVSLFYNNKKIKKTVHRLVAKAFLNNKNDSLVINHKDGNKLNNNVSNLEWITQKENIRHAWENNLSHRTKCRKIKQYDKEGNLIKIYNAVMDAERETGINNSKIVECCKKHYGRKTAGGFRWEYFYENNT
jgi:hypothetical protein